MALIIQARQKAELWFIACLCAVGVAVELLTLFSVLKPEDESVAQWFQRSGAITSIFAIFAQFRLNSFAESIRGGTYAESWSLYNIFIKHQIVTGWVITFIAIWGAIVWGYGDLMIKHFL